MARSISQESPEDRTEQAPPARRTDPVSRVLVWGIAGLLVLWASGMVAAFAFGLGSPSGAPRTETERDLVTLEAQVQSGKADTQIWGRYIDTLVAAGQQDKAGQVLSMALASAKANTSYLLAAEADLRLAEHSYAAAVSAAKQAQAAAEQEQSAVAAAMKKQNITQASPMPESWNAAGLTLAQALAADGNRAGALAAYDAYLARNPTSADVLVARGDLRAAAGDRTGAGKDYRAALAYVPGYPAALQGLKSIGAAS